jgi:hypothetical protein
VHLIRQHYLLLAGTAAAGAAAAVLFFFDPAVSRVFPPCPVRYLTGWYCPGCGSLRAMHQLLHGNLRAALAMNPLTVILSPYVAFGLVSHACYAISGRAMPPSRLPAVWVRILCAVILLFAIARNLPLHPFNLLAPGAMLNS